MRFRKGCIPRFAAERASARRAGPRMAGFNSPVRPTREGPLALHEVDQDVVAEVLRRREERPSAVDLGHLLDERSQRSVGAEAERVDPDLFLRAPHDLTERGLDRLAHRRIVEERVPVRGDVGGRFAVGDHDDLLRARLAGEQLAGEHEPVVHVRAVHEVPRHLGELRRGEHPSGLGEPDDAEVVARELRA